MATPAWFLQGHVTASKLVALRHVANMWVFEQAMWARLSGGSFFDFFPFSRRTLRYYVLSALDFGEFKRFDEGIVLSY